MLSLINREVEAADFEITQAVKTLSSLIVDPSLIGVEQRIQILRLVQGTLNLRTVLDPATFINKSSSNLQSHLWNLIELAGLRRVQDTRNLTDQILTLVFDKISELGSSL